MIKINTTLHNGFSLWINKANISYVLANVVVPVTMKGHCKGFTSTNSNRVLIPLKIAGPLYVSGKFIFHIPVK